MGNVYVKRTHQQKLLGLLTRYHRVHFRTLARMVGHRFGGRIHELSNRGIWIDFVSVGTANLYYLVQPAREVDVDRCCLKVDRKRYQ